MNRFTFIDELWYRWAIGLVGATIGCLTVLGLLGLLVYLDVFSTSLARITGVGAIAGALVGVSAPALVLHAIEAAMWLLAGLFGAMGNIDIETPPRQPRWLLVAFFFGIVYLFILALL